MPGAVTVKRGSVVGIRTPHPSCGPHGSSRIRHDEIADDLCVNHLQHRRAPFMNISQLFHHLV